VNIGASFCNTCRVMQKTTFVDTSVAAYINANFYVVDFNAESPDTILFKNEKYYKSMINNFPLHSLALKLTNNKFSLPALGLLDEQMNTIDALNFYQSPQQIRPILVYVGSNAYKTKPFAEFVKEYSDKMLKVEKKAVKKK
jgi:thioredoxin-related protein